MGRKDRQSKEAARAARIHAMRVREAALRANLDRAMRQGKDISDQAHYYKLGQERLKLGQALIAELMEDFKKARPLLAECIGESFLLDRDCKALQAEIDALQRKPHPKPAFLDEKFLASLPPELAEPARSLAFLHSLGHELRAEEKTKQVFDDATAFVEQLKQKFEKTKQVALEMIEIGREKARRGWAQAAEIETSVSGLNQFESKTDADLTKYIQDLEKAAADRDRALARRRELLRTREALKR